jgi:hypothetical protein
VQTNLKRRIVMRAVLLLFGVLGLGAVIAVFEPARASSPVTSQEVRLVSEQKSDQMQGRTGVKFQRNGRRYRGP